MNMRIRCIPVFILLLCALQAAASPYYFKSMDAREGLSQNTVNAIVEDGGGRRSFFSCAEHPCLSNVTSIFFDAAGNIWIGSYGRGLYVSKDGMETVQPYADPDSGVEIFRDRLITSIVWAPFNNIYVGSLDGGVRSVNLVTGKSAVVLPIERCPVRALCPGSSVRERSAPPG